MSSQGIANNSKLIPLFPTNIMKFSLWDEYEDWDGLLADLMEAEVTENVNCRRQRSNKFPRRLAAKKLLTR